MFFPAVAATEFVIRNQLDRYSVDQAAHSLDLTGPGGRTFGIDVYVSADGTPVGTVLVIHGMALRGYRDPRIVDTCRNLASEGFRVLAPSFEEVAALCMDPDTIDHMADCVRAVCAAPELCPGGRLSIFAPSFSGGMALVVAAKPDIAERINALCTIGPPGHLDSTLHYIFERDDIDDYGRMIVLKNFAHLVLGKRSKLLRAFELAAIDNSFEAPPVQLPAYLETLGRKDRELFDRFRASADFRLEQLDRMLEKDPKTRSALNFAERMSGLSAAVTLIHGQYDPVIPASESVDLERRMKSMGLDVKLEITPLISHGDSAVTPGMMLRLPSLIGAFAHFFRNAADGV